MRLSRTRILAPLVTAVLGASLLAGGSTPVALAQPDSKGGGGGGQHPGSDGPIGDDGRPKHAQHEFRWGPSAWEDEFTQKKLATTWKSNRPSGVRLKVGALTMKSGHGTLTATNGSHPRKYGRWEARVHASESRKDNKHTPYTFVWELIPVGDYACGAKSIVLASYQQDDKVVTGSVRTSPDNVFGVRKRLSQLGFGDFHTYAVEVTKSHISWFVDGSVINTEKRPAVLSGVTYQMQFRMQGEEGKQMNDSTLQMDWVRYYTLERKNKRSIKAPEMKLRQAASTC